MAKKKADQQAEAAAWFDQQTDEDKRTIALNAIARLIEIDDVRFREAGTDADDTPIEACLYWEACGEDLRVPF